MEIYPKTLKSIIEYCELNEIKDIDKFINELIITGFNIEKYGAKPAIDPRPIIEYKPTEPNIKTEEIKHGNIGNDDDYKVYDYK